MWVCVADCVYSAVGKEGKEEDGDWPAAAILTDRRQYWQQLNSTMASTGWVAFVGSAGVMEGGGDSVP